MAGINFENEEEYYGKPLKFNNGYAAVGSMFTDKEIPNFNDWALDLGYTKMNEKMYKNGCNWVSETDLKIRYKRETKH